MSFFSWTRVFASVSMHHLLDRPWCMILIEETFVQKNWRILVVQSLISYLLIRLQLSIWPVVCQISFHDTSSLINCYSKKYSQELRNFMLLNFLGCWFLVVYISLMSEAESKGCSLYIYVYVYVYIVNHKNTLMSFNNNHLASLESERFFLV